MTYTKIQSRDFLNLTIMYMSLTGEKNWADLFFPLNLI